LATDSSLKTRGKVDIYTATCKDSNVRLGLNMEDVTAIL